ncbi:MAG: adenine methyltransferase YhdJ [Planctomycetota bacterium]|jgi:site-specific DNA-methyltransferase (adenine-specific)
MSPKQINASPKTAAVTLPPKLLNTIHHGDCLETLARLPDQSIHLAFADPPFNIGYEYDEYDDRMQEAQYIEWCTRWMQQLHRVLISTGTFWLAIGDEYAAELKVAAKQVGFHCRSWVIWYYTFGVHCKYKFTRSHAHLFHFVKDPRQFTFNHTDIRVPSARQLVYGDPRAESSGRLPDDTWILRPQDCPEAFTAEEDTWYFPRVAGTFKERAGYHGCQMPEQLLARIIRACSSPGEVVLDPFAGSASTLITAKKLGRSYLGCELSEEYTKQGIARLENVSVGTPLVGAKNPLLSAPSTAKGRRLEDKQAESANASPAKRGKKIPTKPASPDLFPE